MFVCHEPTWCPSELQSLLIRLHKRLEDVRFHVDMRAASVPELVRGGVTVVTKV